MQTQQFQDGCEPSPTCQHASSIIDQLPLNPSTLHVLAEARGPEFRSAHTFPHAVFDNFFPADVLKQVVGDMPKKSDAKWTVYDRVNELKFVCSNVNAFGPTARALVHELNSSAFLTFLEVLTGIKGLIPDPHLRNAGFFEIPPGGFLNIHADFSHNRYLQLVRRLNVIVYLNEQWESDWGGEFEMWATGGSEPAQSVLPIFNRLVIFQTTGKALHGHPNPVACPEGMSRKCLAFYYFTSPGVSEDKLRHGVLFQDNPYPVVRTSTKFKRFAQRILPPIIFDAVRGIRRRSG